MGISSTKELTNVYRNHNKNDRLTIKNAGICFKATIYYFQFIRQEMKNKRSPAFEFK